MSPCFAADDLGYLAGADVKLLRKDASTNTVGMKTPKLSHIGFHQFCVVMPGCLGRGTVLHMIPRLGGPPGNQEILCKMCKGSGKAT